MKKFIRLIAGVLILVVVALVVMLVFWLGPFSQKAVEKWGPQVLGVEVKLQEVSIRPFSGTVRIEGLYVGNPKGYANPSLMEVGDLRANLQLSSLWSDTIVIEELLIDRPLITYEKKSGTDNFKSLLANVDAFTKRIGAGDKKDADADKPSKKVIIEHLLVTNGQVRTKLGVLPTATFVLPDIERHHLGGKSEGMNYGQAAKEVMGSLHDGSLDALKNGVKVAGDVIKSVGDAAGEAGDKAKEAGDKVIEGAGDAVKGIGDLFKK